MSGFWKVCSYLCTQYLVGPPFTWTTVSTRRGMETISLWYCSGVFNTTTRCAWARHRTPQNWLSSEKRSLEHWATVQFLFSSSQVRCFWRCFCFRSGLVALFLKMSERGDSWCTDSSFSPLLVKLSQVFESALLDSILKLAVIPVACATFPIQFRIHIYSFSKCFYPKRLTIEEYNNRYIIKRQTVTGSACNTTFHALFRAKTS